MPMVGQWRPHRACNVVEAENPRCGVVFKLHCTFASWTEVRISRSNHEQTVPPKPSLHGQHVKAAGFAPGASTS